MNVKLFCRHCGVEIAHVGTTLMFSDPMWRHLPEPLLPHEAYLNCYPVSGCNPATTAEPRESEDDVYAMFRAHWHVGGYCMPNMTDRENPPCICTSAIAGISDGPNLDCPRHGRWKTHFECDCVPDLGPSHCHGCSDDRGEEVSWADRSCGASTDGAS